MDMDIVINNPLITLKPNPNSKEYLEIDLGRITVKNARTKDDSRLLECNVKEEIKETFSDNFYI
jgi:vacuolar protein sorting-associated protein 13A/C